MLKYIVEVGKFVEITGFRNIDVKNAEEFVKMTCEGAPRTIWIQVFDAKLVATWQHLYFAILNALLAFKNQINISKSVAMETILYASAQRQIRKAIDLIGVKYKSANVAVIIIGDAEPVKAFLSVVSKRVGKEPDDEILEISKNKMRDIRKAFGVTVTELKTVIEKNNREQALVDLVIERMALLSTQL